MATFQNYYIRTPRKLEKQAGQLNAYAEEMGRANIMLRLQADVLEVRDTARRRVPAAACQETAWLQQCSLLVPGLALICHNHTRLLAKRAWVR